MVGSLFLAYMVGKAQVFLAIPFIFPAAVFGFLAAPFKKDQPTETWAVAKVRFLFKPRKRIWDQSGQKDLVEVTAPKKEVVDYTDGLSQNDVKRRLSALASTIDSRGWVIKTGAPAMNSIAPTIISGGANESDRLTGSIALPSAVPNFDQSGIMPVDVLDEAAGVAQNFDKLIASSKQAHREQIMNKLSDSGTTSSMPQTSSSSATQTDDPINWFQPQTNQMRSDNLSNSNASQPSTQIGVNDEKALLAELNAKKQADFNAVPKNMKVINPINRDKNSHTISSKQVPNKANQPTKKTDSTVTANTSPAIINLSRNDDLDIATIARQANKQSDNNEVVISLH